MKNLSIHASWMCAVLDGPLSSLRLVAIELNCSCVIVILHSRWLQAGRISIAYSNGGILTGVLQLPLHNSDGYTPGITEWIENNA